MNNLAQAVTEAFPEQANHIVPVLEDAYHQLAEAARAILRAGVMALCRRKCSGCSVWFRMKE
jgi:hypothetical protein